jgi:hypothetical protein
VSNNEFSQSVSIDFAPKGSLCEWCGKLAVLQVTAIGGKSHNEGGFFCQMCGEIFIQDVTRSQKNVTNAPSSEEGQVLSD